jgi:hypothetical protein
MAYLVPSDTNTFVDKLFVGGAFIGSGIFGISLAINPGWMKKFTKQLKKTSVTKPLKKPKIKIKGHHPDCEKFKNHIINANSKSYCAGCLGLSIGSVISITAFIIYIITEVKYANFFQYLIILGLFFIGIAYIEILVTKRNAVTHVISNIFLVIGFFLVIISMLEITGNKIYALIGVTFSFLWLDTRVQLSSWQHTKICKNCNKSCKIY